MAIFVPSGFTNPLPVETGQAPNTVLGRLTGTAAITEFYYVKTILRTINTTNVQTMRESWTIQIVESNDPNARVLFDHTVDMGITTFSGGIGGYGWFYVLDNGQSIGKFKTREINSSRVAQVPETFPGQNTPTSPLAPDYPYLSALKTTSITAQLPPRPTGIVKLALWACKDANGTYIKVGEGVGGEKFTVTTGQVGANKPEDIWFYVEAVPATGLSVVGPKVKDSFTQLDGTTQIGGYKGWEHIGGAVTRPTVFSETSLSTEAENGGGIMDNTIRGTWQSPVYKCQLPPNAIVKIVHDGWAGASVIQNKFTFAFGFKYGNDTILFSPKTQETWAVYRGKPKAGVSPLKCARTLKVTSFKLDEETDGPLKFHENNRNVERVWMFHGKRTWLYGFAQQGDKVYNCFTRFKGRIWEEGVKVLEGVQIMGMVANDDASLVWCYGNKSGKPVRVILKRTRHVPEELEGKVDSPTLKSPMIWRATTNEEINVKNIPEADLPPWFQAPFGITRPHGQTGLAYVWFKVNDRLKCFETTEYFRVWKIIDLADE